MSVSVMGLKQGFELFLPGLREGEFGLGLGLRDKIRELNRIERWG